MCLSVNPRKPPCNHSSVKTPQNLNRLAIHPGRSWWLQGPCKRSNYQQLERRCAQLNYLEQSQWGYCVSWVCGIYIITVHIHCLVLIEGFNNEGENCLVVTVIRRLPVWFFLLFCQLPVKANQNGILPHSNTHGDICCNVCTHTWKLLLINKENSLLVREWQYPMR